MYKTITVTKRVMYCDLSGQEITEKEDVVRIANILDKEPYVISQAGLAMVPEALRQPLFLELFCDLYPEKQKEKLKHLWSGVWVLETGGSTRSSGSTTLFNTRREATGEVEYADFFHTIDQAEGDVLAYIRRKNDPAIKFYFFNNGEHIMTLTQEIKVNKVRVLGCTGSVGHTCPTCLGKVSVGGVGHTCPTCLGKGRTVKFGLAAISGDPEPDFVQQVFPGRFADFQKQHAENAREQQQMPTGTKPLPVEGAAQMGEI